MMDLHPMLQLWVFKKTVNGYTHHQKMGQSKSVI